MFQEQFTPHPKNVITANISSIKNKIKLNSLEFMHCFIYRSNGLYRKINDSLLKPAIGLIAGFSIINFRTRSFSAHLFVDIYRRVNFQNLGC